MDSKTDSKFYPVSLLPGKGKTLLSYSLSYLYEDTQPLP